MCMLEGQGFFKVLPHSTLVMGEDKRNESSLI
jgi:hypothetical protein